LSAARIVGFFIAAGLASLLSAQTLPPLSITVHTDSGAAIPGATIDVQRDGQSAGRAATRPDGKIEIPRLAPGQYTVLISHDGFEPTGQTITIADERQQIDLDVTLVSKLRRADSVDVLAEAEGIEAQTATPVAAELRSSQVESLPSRPSTVSDALPLVPGVSRGANGEIQISGQSEQQSALLVNASNVTDPTTGGFGKTVPVDSVESINVLKTPFLPQYGGFTAGVVDVETKRGGDKWRYSVKDPFPDFRIRSGRLHGLRDTTPRISIGGPLIANKLFLSQSGQYLLEKKQTRTLPFPYNESKNESVNSFTQFDYILSPAHFITTSVHLAPGHVNFVDPQFFNPQPVTPSLRNLERAFAVTDHLTMHGGLLESSLTHQGFNARIGAQGDADMVLTPAGNTGNYFARRTRNASRSEWLETFSITRGTSHSMKFGSVAARVANSGSFAFRSIEILDSNQQMLERIDFAGGAPFERTDMEAALFAQDHWTVLPSLSIDGGGRIEYQARTSSVRTAPRIAMSWAPFGEGKLIVRSGIGLFYDRVPLSIYSFGHYPSQIVTTYDPAGNTISQTERFSNTMDIDTHPFPFVGRGSRHGNFAPHSQTWTLELERTVAKSLHVRVNYQHSNSGDEVLLTPRTVDGSGFHALGGGGQSTYRQFEATARVTWKGGQQMMFSYVHSKARGDLNTFNTYLSDFPAVPIQQNRFSNLRGDMPNRFIAWGSINMPWKARLAPIFEYHTGLPYAVLEAGRNYVGIPYGDKTRFRSYVGLDERLSREFAVTKKYKARISATMFNTLNHFNPLDVHANTADPLFGTFFGHYKRRYRGDFELLF
jgi:hypothetical protein